MLPRKYEKEKIELERKRIKKQWSQNETKATSLLATFVDIFLYNINIIY